MQSSMIDFNKIDAYLDEKLAGLLESIMDKVPMMPENVLGINPGKAYKMGEVADLLGVTPETVSRMTEEELPRVRRNASQRGVMGINILCYMHGLDPIDTEQITRNFIDRYKDRTPKIKPLKKGERRRIK